MKLYRYEQDFGRMGSLDGMFFATDEEYDRFMGREGYASDILGKHSEVYLEFSEETIEEVPLSETTIEEMFEVLGAHVSGVTPLDFFEQWDEEDEAIADEYEYDDDDE